MVNVIIDGAGFHHRCPTQLFTACREKLSSYVLFLLYGAKSTSSWEFGTCPTKASGCGNGSVAAKLAARRSHSTKPALPCPAPPYLSAKWKPEEAIGRASPKKKTKCRLGVTEMHIREPLCVRQGERERERGRARERQRERARESSLNALSFGAPSRTFDSTSQASALALVPNPSSARHCSLCLQHNNNKTTTKLATM